MLGGAETFLMKIYRNIDRSKYQMDFCVAAKEKCFYDDEIISMGGKIFHITPKSKGIIKNFKSIKDIVKNEKYEYVMRVSQHSLSALELLAAKLGGAKKLIFRSSNSNTGGNTINQMLHYVFRFISIKVPNVKIAPSTEAAIFMFGKRSVKKNKVIILHNAIPFEKYKFDENVRIEQRKELGIEDKFVIGHVGRLTKQKNHKFLLKIFKKVKEQEKNAILLLIGKGELKEEIEEIINNYGLKDSVKLLGVKDNVNELMMAMDVYAFPSLYEGLPNTVVEAQATDLKCVISNKITKEVNITENVKFLNIEDKDIDEWVKEILKVKDITNNKRINQYKNFEKKKYTIDNMVDTFIKNVY